jgi:Histidine kinase
MTMHVSAALIEDRHRIARALHDTVAPKVMTLGMHVACVRGVVSDPEIVGRLAETELLARETMDAIRQSIFELSCLGEVPRHRLVAGLRQIVSEYRPRVSRCRSASRVLRARHRPRSNDSSPSLRMRACEMSSPTPGRHAPWCG